MLEQRRLWQAKLHRPNGFCRFAMEVLTKESHHFSHRHVVMTFDVFGIRLARQAV